MSLNIQGVNYSTNVQNNVNISHNSNGQVQISVPANLSAGEAGISLLQHLSVGDKFTGEITNITQNQITIALSDTVSVSAYLSDALSYNIGDIATFSIKESGKDVVVLKSENNHMSNLMNDQSINTALRNAEVPVNATTVSLVHNMMKQNLPLDAHTLGSYAKILTENPYATPEDVVLLTKMDIPVTPENVAAFHDYNNYSEGMTAKAFQMSNAINDMLMTVASENQQEAGVTLNNILNSYSPAISAEEPIEIIFSENEAENFANMIKEAAKDNPDAVLLSDKIISGKSTAKEVLTDFSKLMEENAFDKEELPKLLKQPEFGKLTDNFIRQELFIAPKDISKDNISRLFEKILRDSDKLSDKFQNNPKAETVLQVNNSVRGDVNFMNQLNGFMNFVQIPLKMAGQNAHGDLYVYKRNGQRTPDKDDFSALLHLDMDNLGPLDIFVRLKERNVTTNFKVSTDEILDYIEAHMDELTARLNALGYNVSANVTSDSMADSTPYSFKKDVIEAELPSTEIKRFSFDVRA